jgi:amidase
MDRRDFVRLGAVAGALTLRGKPLSAEIITGEEKQALRTATNHLSNAPFALDETTLADLQAAMASGRMTARSITQQYIDRIQALDRTGPTLRAVLEINPDALSIADTLDRERRQAKCAGLCTEFRF